MNKVILMGRLTRDPEVRYPGGEGKAVARFTLAIDRKFKQQEGPTADFISCVAFGKNAEFVDKYLRQGIKIATEGRIQTGSYTNRDGNKVYTTDVVIESMEFAESKNAAGHRESDANTQQKVDADGFMNIPDGIDEELPFS